MKGWAARIATVLLLVSGCAAPLGPKFDGPHPAKAGYATVYVYRQQDDWSGRVPSGSLLVDGKPMAELVARGYIVLFLAPGSHVFRPRWDSLPQSSGPSARVAVRDGQELYMKLRSSSSASASGQTQYFSARWHEVPKSMAMQELREYGLVAVVSH